jgi:hypothetical protein
MHAEAYAWVSRYATDKNVSVLDIGGRDINGSPRKLFPSADPYTVLDILPGANVDIVADAATWRPEDVYDVVVCCEVFEHTPDWREIIGTAHYAARGLGVFIATMAGPGRVPHSAVDGGPLREIEHYQNIDPDELYAAVAEYPWDDFEIDVHGTDVRLWAVR